MVRLEEITPDNWRIELKVAKEQQDYVSSQAGLLARAYAYRNENSYACIIYDDNIPLGMALYYDCEELNAYDFSQLFVDKRYQQKGYGKKAAKLILEKMKEEGRYSEVVLCYIEGNIAAKRLYENLGFTIVATDEDEIIMRKNYKNVLYKK